MYTKIKFLYFILFMSVFLSIQGESMISINRSSQKYGEEFQIDDYRQTFQTTEISDYPINGILYPVMGFPSMIAEELLSLSVIFKFKTEGRWLSEYDIEYVKIIRTDDSGKHEFLSLYPRYKGVVYKIGTDLWILKIGMASMLPEARYDIVLKIFNEGSELECCLFPA